MYFLINRKKEFHRNRQIKPRI